MGVMEEKESQDKMIIDDWVVSIALAGITMSVCAIIIAILT
jgi:hypothetical protein